MDQQPVLFDNTTERQFEFRLNGHIARSEYILAGDRIYLTHTEIPPELEGQGLGSRLIAAILPEIEKRGLALIPLCPFVAAYLNANPEWNRLLHPSVNTSSK